MDLKTPGRSGDEAKLYTKADYKAKQQAGKDILAEEAAAFLADLGGPDNIVDVTNCATRLRVTVKDESLLADAKTFEAHGARGLVHNGCALQIIIGLSVPQVRERFETLLEEQLAHQA